MNFEDWKQMVGPAGVAATDQINAQVNSDVAHIMGPIWAMHRAMRDEDEGRAIETSIHLAAYLRDLSPQRLNVIVAKLAFVLTSELMEKFGGFEQMENACCLFGPKHEHDACPNVDKKLPFSETKL